MCNDLEECCLLTFSGGFAIVYLVIVLRKLEKPAAGGEPAGLSLFYFKEKCNGFTKKVFYFFRTGRMASK